jgi:hypothetical protein
MSDKVVIECDSGEADVEDGGAARILHIEPDDLSDVFFVRLQSYDMTGEHTVIRQFEGKRVRVTVEVV